MPKAYLRGLTQAEENQEGVDFFAELAPNARIFAFQFKAPHGKTDLEPYKYTLVRYQHDPLFQLSQLSPRGVFYVFPYYVTVAKLQKDVPTLMLDTWFLSVAQMPSPQLFGSSQSRIIRCMSGNAVVNPEYKLEGPHDVFFNREDAVPARRFVEWYGSFREVRSRLERRRNPWLARGLRVAVVL